MNSYILKPYRNEIDRGWILTNHTGVILYERHKNIAIQRSRYYVKSKGGGELTLLKISGEIQRTYKYHAWAYLEKTIAIIKL